MRYAYLLLLAVALPGRAELATYPEMIAPLLERSCAKCHGPAKQKAGLRLDSLEAVLTGSKDGVVVNPGDPEASELIRRVSLPPGDEDLMPSGNHPPLSSAEITALRSWIAAEAPAAAPFDPEAAPQPVAPLPAAPDYRPRLARARALAQELGVALVPRSRVPTDGLILRTASSPGRCDDSVLEKLAPIGDLIVEAELARTPVSDRGMRAVGTWANLERLDLTRTSVTSDSLALLLPLRRLAFLNLTQTKVEATGPELAGRLPSVLRMWAFKGP